MLQPKRTKYRKQQKGRNRGLAHRGSTVAFGSFGLKTLEKGWITNRQKEHLIKFELVQGALCQNQMADVRRIKCPAHQAYFLT